MKPKKKFYDSGVLFTCTECGNCCSHPDGVVDLGQQEAKAIAEALGISFETFLTRYVEKAPSSQQLSLRSLTNGDCIFLKDERCTVYAARPLQCRTFPFWPEVMKSEHRWNITAESCPGMNSGKVYSRKDIVEKLRRMREYQQELQQENHDSDS